jgi:hypothetical protein
MADLESNDPNSICNSLLHELKKMGFVADFPPQKLRLGCGEPVCKVLEFISDQALARMRFQV